MSPFTDLSTLPGHFQNKYSDFDKVRQSPSTSRTPVAMGPTPDTPGGSSRMAIQAAALTTLNFPKSAKVLQFPTPKALPDDLPNPSPTKSDRDDSAGPLPERARLPTCPADWEAKKEIIRGHYMEKNMILNDVMEIMVRKHKFKAT